MAQEDNAGEDFESVYDDGGREELVEDDEISPEEEAFMAGYDESGDEDNEDDSDEAYDKAFEESDSKSKKRKK